MNSVFFRCSKILGYVFIAMMSFATLMAFDIPVRYHAPAFQGTPASTTTDWAFFPEVRYRFGSSRRAYDIHSQRTELFNLYGPFNIAALGVNVSDKGSLVEGYWPDNNLFNNLGADVFGDFVCNKKCAGVVEFLGKYQVHAVDIIWRQNLLWGLFAHLYLPVRDITVNSICYRYCSRNPSDGNEQVKDFLENNFDNLLAERGIKPIGTPFNRTAIADPVLSFGWQGQTNERLGIIDELKGMLMLGILFPFGPAYKTDHVFSLPLGHNHHWGFNMRVHAQAGLWSIVNVGISAGVLSLLGRTSGMRLKTDKRQNGWVMLEKALANEDAGAVWDLSAYIGIEPDWYGLNALVGFSFTRQESSHVHVRDECFLKEVRDASLVAAASPIQSLVVTPDDIVNTDSRFRDWEMYVLHFHVAYDMAQHLNCSFAPRFTFHYDYQIIGKHTFATDMVGGTIGLSCAFKF